MTNCSENTRSQAESHGVKLADRIRENCRSIGGAETFKAIESVGVCGVGVMGAGVAATSLQYDIPVVAHDASAEAMDRGFQLIKESLSQAGSVGDPDGIRDPALPPIEDMLVATAQVEGLAVCDLVVESVVENKELKQRVLGQLEAILSREAILTTNTSTLPITGLATALSHPDRFCGIHFFNPVEHRPLVEIIPASQTSPATVAAAVSFATRIGKLPIIVKDRPGFLVNRLLVPYLNEALELLLEGIDSEDIDRAAVEFGMPIGPLALFDLIGTETAMLGGRTIWEAFPDRVTLTPILPALVKRGRMGRKSRVGFYRYDDEAGNGQQNDPDFQRIIEPYVRAPSKSSPNNIALRLLLPMLVEATRALEDEIVLTADEVDAGVLFGLAFPPARGGLLYWADQLGAQHIVELLKPFEHLGKRMQPSDHLLEMAAKQQSFFEET